MNNIHILNVKKTWFILILTFVITYILAEIIINEPTLNESVVEFKTILSFLIPGVLAMLTIYVSGIAIMVGTLRMELIKESSDEYKRNLKKVIGTFKYASKTSAILFVMMTITYLMLSVNYSIGIELYLRITIALGFTLVYILLFLVQFTVYLVGMLIRIFEMNL